MSGNESSAAQPRRTMTEHAKEQGWMSDPDVSAATAELRALVQEAHDRLREYEAERAHGLTQNPQHLDNCVTRAERLIVQALTLLGGVE